jgi:hypothetical protein
MIQTNPTPERDAMLSTLIEYAGFKDLWDATKTRAQEKADGDVAAAKVPKTGGTTKLLFISCPHGEETMRFARFVKDSLETDGYQTFFDEEGIASGVDLKSTTGHAIKECDGLVAIINETFSKSTFCNNEVAMAEGNGLEIFPIIYRKMSFSAMPDRLQYMLAANLNYVPFPDAESDAASMAKMLARLQAVFQDGDKSEADAMAAVPSTVPELPDVLSERAEMVSDMLARLLGFLASNKVSLSSVKGKSTSTTKVAAHGQGGVGKTTMAAALVNDTMTRRAFEKIG